MTSTKPARTTSKTRRARSGSTSPSLGSGIFPANPQGGAWRTLGSREVKRWPNNKYVGKCAGQILWSSSSCDLDAHRAAGPGGLALDRGLAAPLGELVAAGRTGTGPPSVVQVEVRRLGGGRVEEGSVEEWRDGCGKVVRLLIAAQAS